MTNPPFKQNLLYSSVSLRRAISALCLLMCVPMAAQALSLGRSRGAVLLGQPLNLSILASVEPQEETPEPACFSAEVFYGDNRVSNQNVFLSVARSSPTELTLRVRGSTIVDEPVVTVYVKAGCNQNTSSRRYVLLPDAPSEPAPASAFSPPVNIPLGPTPVPRDVPLAAPKAEAPPVSAQEAAIQAANRAERRAERVRLRAEQKAARPQPTVPKQAVAAPKARAPGVVAQSAAKPSGKALLKLDLLDLTSGTSPSLRASAEMLTLPTTDNAARAKAAMLWRAINAQPEDILRDAQRLMTIETEVRGMQDVTKRQTQELTVLKTDLARAQQERYVNPLVFALGLLALGALGWAIYLYRQRRSSGQSPWWGSVDRFNAQEGNNRLARAQAAVKQSGYGGSQTEASDRSRTVYPSSAAAVPASSSASAFAASGAGALAGDGDAATSVRQPVQWRDSLTSDLSAISPSSPRAVNAEELFDIQQQADFFLSLGQHSQAIDILQNHISENVETSALAYLDLFNIYHQVGQQAEYEMLRNDFNMVFNAQVPSFEEYGQNSRGLDQYDAALSRIQALWPGPKALDVIEESIFRKPDHENQPFDLAAYRELMLLYAVAKDIIEQDGAAVIDPTVSYTQMQPLPGLVSDPVVSSSQIPSHSITQPVPAVAPASNDTGVDIELDIFGEGPLAKPSASLPQATTPVTKADAPDSGSIDFDIATSSEFDRLQPHKP